MFHVYGETAFIYHRPWYPQLRVRVDVHGIDDMPEIIRSVQLAVTTRIEYRSLGGKRPDRGKKKKTKANFAALMIVNVFQRSELYMRWRRGKVSVIRAGALSGSVSRVVTRVSTPIARIVSKEGVCFSRSTIQLSTFSKPACSKNTRKAPPTSRETEPGRPPIYFPGPARSCGASSRESRSDRLV